MKTVLVGGCFDLIHFGHIAFLEEAKKYGDKLLVLLESDETIKRLKGEGRPFHTQAQRRRMLEAIRAVDEVMILPSMENDKAYFDLIVKIHPDVIAFTEDDPISEKKMRQAELAGAKAVIIQKIQNPSTSSLAKLLKLE